ncbi:hypothetical protein HPB50_017106 [Hyalomma asiaticum]|uniref:Uncharacterized protein n=1 Tax=Hyalomma asiaticum TaxID=266040 RepID=A0ACB7T501_HYAAI|nr:hypothetical protein HPB50_017106 [Hyalomma asiaticum]
MSSYELPANADEHVLRRKIDEVEGNLLSLNISNCIVAHPSRLLSLLSRLTNLQVLSCIACPLKPSLLLKALLLSLQNLTRLEFSLVETENDAIEELIEIEHFHEEHIGKHTNLSDVYVEVASETNMKVLVSFLRYCPLLIDIHVYVANCIPSDYVAAWSVAIIESLGEHAIFTLNCESPSTMQSERTQPLDLQTCMDTHGTVVFSKGVNALSYALLSDLATSTKPVFPVEPVVLVAFQSSGLHKELLDAGARYNWSWLQSLCFLLLHTGHHNTVYPVVETRHRTVMRDFFSRLSNIVELNVSCFHFGDGIDITELIPAAVLKRLRALSLAPCALPPNGAVLRLVMDLSNMEDLDIRLHLDGRHGTCRFCAEALTIPPIAASAFHLRSGRLTLSNIPRLTSFDFLGCLQVSHVRFIADHGLRDPNSAYDAFCKAVCSNRNIRSIVIKLPYIDFRRTSFETSLCPGDALECLCLLAARSRLRASEAARIVVRLATNLPSAFYVHIHYVDIDSEAKD